MTSMEQRLEDGDFDGEDSFDCEYGHTCTSRCQKDKDCPCVTDHYCSNTNEGKNHTVKDCDENCLMHAEEREGIALLASKEK